MLPQFKIHDSMTGRLVHVDTVKPGSISLYVCGTTVYDHCHIGHGRTRIVFDAWVRMARACGYKVHYVTNITDVDDKIIAKATKTNQASAAVSDFYTAKMNEIDQQLNLLHPTDKPKATDYINAMKEMIGKLIDKGAAYLSHSGDVYFSVESFPDYGRLSKQQMTELWADSRPINASSKRHKSDFVLWKRAKPEEPSWSSPWGLGRPGWHIECSAMATNILGETFDIHGGGMDLKFPHHENEIAQAKSACSGDYARAWMHVGLVMMGQDKMSKSLGNTLLLKDILAHVPGDALRFMYLQTHYRKPLFYTEEHLHMSMSSWRRLQRLLKDVPVKPMDISPFIEALVDDFNTPLALAELFEWRRQSEKLTGSERLVVLQKMKYAASLLGLFQDEQVKSEPDVSRIEQLIAQRSDARLSGNYAKADAIRDQLLREGIQLDDNAQGTQWHQV